MSIEIDRTCHSVSKIRTLHGDMSSKKYSIQYAINPTVLIFFSADITEVLNIYDFFKEGKLQRLRNATAPTIK